MTKSECLTKSEIRNPKVVPRLGKLVLRQTLAARGKAGPDPTDEQKKAVATKHVSVVLSAGAGCGKTWVLTKRFLSHLEPGPGCAELSSLVAITFTEKSAREMRERIRQACVKQLQTADAKDADHWLAIVREMDSARISTIHSFCSSLLRSHAVEAGIDPGFSLLNETLGPSYLQQAVKSGVHELLTADDADVAELVFEFGLSRACELLAMFVQERYRIDFAQWEQKTVQHLAGEWDERWHKVFVPRLLREAADSKLAERLIELLDEHVPANAVMRERRLVLLENVRRLAEDEIDVQTRLELLKQNARVQGGGTKKDWESEGIYTDVKETLADFRTLIEKLQKQLDFDPAYSLRGAEIGLCALRAAAKVGAVYDAEKAEAGLLDFDDLLLRTRNLLRDHDDVHAGWGPAFRFSWSMSFRTPTRFRTTSCGSSVARNSSMEAFS